MNKTVTLGDYIREAEVFRYSKDYFDMIKEASEIELMSIELQSNYFIIENADLIEGSYSNINSLFIETTNSGEVDNQSTGKKLMAAGSKLMGKIWAAIIKVLKFLMRPFQAISTAITTVCNKAEEDFEEQKLIDNLDKLTSSNITVTEESIRKFEEEIDKQIDKLEKEVDPDILNTPSTSVEDNKDAMRNVELIAKKTKISAKYAAKLRKLAAKALNKSIKVSGLMDNLWEINEDFKNVMNEISSAVSTNKPGSIDVSKKLKSVNDSIKSSLEDFYSLAKFSDLRRLNNKISAIRKSIEDTINNIESFKNKSDNSELNTWLTDAVKHLTETNALITENSTNLVNAIKAGWLHRILVIKAVDITICLAISAFVLAIN